MKKYLLAEFHFYSDDCGYSVVNSIFQNETELLRFLVKNNYCFRLKEYSEISLIKRR